LLLVKAAVLRKKTVEMVKEARTMFIEAESDEPGSSVRALEYER
jgi:hypothetical protein